MSRVENGQRQNSRTWASKELALVNSMRSRSQAANLDDIPSDIEKGTLSTFASVRAKRVFPDPVGPNKRTLLLSKMVVGGPSDASVGLRACVCAGDVDGGF